ncbi:MAG: DNA repair protein RadC [Caldilineaceae bacterium]|nr:DNA repair protein RadC [Caldilineaceae bacterium]
MTTQPSLFDLQHHAHQSPLTIRELPVSERPHTRLEWLGTSALSLRELLAVLIGGNDAFTVVDSLLRRANTIGEIARLSYADLVAVPGITPTRAARIKATVELACRLQNTLPEDKFQIRSPADVANLLMIEMALLDHEQLRIVLLDTKNRVQDIVTLYVGSLSTAVIRIGEVFKEALRRNMAAIIIVHNHPSGDPMPSPEDVRVTQKIVDAGQLLNIDVLDHLVIGYNRYVSLKERGLGFN